MLPWWLRKMAISIISTKKEFLCVSGDSKPTDIVVGSEMYETDTGSTYVFDGAAWVKIRDLAVSVSNDLWDDTRFDWTSGDLDYKGKNETHKALVTATDWQIYKYTWAAGLPTRIEGPLEGSWTGRAALSWA
jgi:hypothetical protein